MKTYTEILAELSAMKDETYRVFNERIVNIPAGSSLGGRTPRLRAPGQQLGEEGGVVLDALLAFPDDLFEIRLLKCFAVGMVRMPFEEKISYIERCLPVVDGWAVCDLFCSTLKEVKKHRAAFLPYIETYVAEGSEFSQRFGYIMLLGCYMQAEYLPAIFRLLDGAKSEHYYAHMGAAWLLAEVLTRFFAEGVRYLQKGALAQKSKKKAVQKARESFRVSEEQKNYLKDLKIC